MIVRKLINLNMKVIPFFTLVLLIAFSFSLSSQNLDTTIIFEGIKKKNIELKKNIINLKCSNENNVKFAHVLCFSYIGKIIKEDFLNSNFLKNLRLNYFIKKKWCKEEAYIESLVSIFDTNNINIGENLGITNNVFCRAAKVKVDSAYNNYYRNVIDQALIDVNTKLAFRIYGSETYYLTFIMNNLNQINVIIRKKDGNAIKCTLSELVNLYWSKAGYVDEN